MIDKELGKQIVETYKYIEQMEGKHHTFPPNVARRIVSMVKDVYDKLGSRDVDYFTNELAELEDYLHRKGTFDAIQTNLGVRGHLHALIERYNLLDIQTGWEFDGQVQHYLNKGKTYCGLEKRAESQPGFSVTEGWKVCKVCFDTRVGVEAENDRQYYNNPVRVELSRYKVTADYSFNPAKIEYTPKIKVLDASTIMIKEKEDRA